MEFGVAHVADHRPDLHERVDELVPTELLERRQEHLALLVGRPPEDVDVDHSGRPALHLRGEARERLDGLGSVLGARGDRGGHDGEDGDDDSQDPEYRGGLPLHDDLPARKVYAAAAPGRGTARPRKMRMRRWSRRRSEG